MNCFNKRNLISLLHCYTREQSFDAHHKIVVDTDKKKERENHKFVNYFQNMLGLRKIDESSFDASHSSKTRSVSSIFSIHIHEQSSNKDVTLYSH